MNKLCIKATELSPFVEFTPSNGNLIIKGSAIVDDATNFYRTILENIEEYTESPFEKTTVTIALDYLTIPSAKELLTILKLIEGLDKSGKSKTKINWHFSNRDIEEEGETFKMLIRSPFNILKK